MFRSEEFVLFVSLIMLAGCSEPQRGGPRVTTTPVSGIVMVNGEAAAYLQIDCHPDAGSEIKYPISTITDEHGKFAFTTYEASDGLPEGSYKFTFSWLEPGIVQNDRLNGLFVNPNESIHKLTVVKGQESPFEIIDLTTQ